VGGTPEVNADITRDLLSGRTTGAKRNIVLLNAGAAIYAAGAAPSIDKGIDIAAECIDSGKALRTMEEFDGTKVVLAHHKNDSVETFFMNLARGTGVKGMGGIRPVAGVYVRPLLCLERREIEAFLEERRISYCTDLTNESDDYTRNRIRNHVIPYLEREVNTCTVAHIGDVMERLQEVQSYLEGQTEIYFEQCVKESEKGYIVLEEPFCGIPALFRPLILKKVLVSICKKEKNIEEIHIQELQKLFDKQVGKQVDLPYEMYGKRSYEGVQIQKKNLSRAEDIQVEISFLDGKQQSIKWKEFKIICKLLENVVANEKHLEKINTKQFDYDIITHGVCIRTRQPGDYITIHPDGRTQKLKAFFINEKIPQEKRDQVLLVADGHHILWVFGYRTSCIYQVGKHTKRVLEIQVDKGESHGSEN